LKAARTGGPIGAEVSVNAQGAGPAFATHVCDVEVDPETGHVKVLRYTATQDVGRAIHPSYVEGQIQGGVTQGIGWALSEEYIYDKQGRMDNPGFLDYRCPVASDMPMIDAVLVEVPNPRHPYGVRGVGEVPIVPPMRPDGGYDGRGAEPASPLRRARCRRGTDRAADATGRRLRDLPMSPPKVLSALAEPEPEPQRLAAE
jgi:CO/xanthine dehydrogenase Mo-binding subunit